jgi:glycosyltransferase involved in cell wall biosynthesis
MRSWDLQASKQPDIMIANSGYIKNQIKKYYGREATVIHPPVDTERFAFNESGGERKGFVIAGRQTVYKRIDLAVAACSQLNLPLTVLGRGPDHSRLVSMAGPSVSFIEDATDAMVVKHFQQAEAFIFPGLDDFGIVAVEALAAGTPVIAYKDGGALDYVKPGVTGVFFDEQTAESLANTLREFSSKSFNHTTLKEQAEQFSPAHFKQRLGELFKTRE